MLRKHLVPVALLFPDMPIATGGDQG